MPLCPICGEELAVTTVETLKCNKEDQHPLGSPKVGSAALGCPETKGAIWVYVTDDKGTGVRDIPVSVTGGPKNTDGTGFSSFDPLAPGSYDVKIALPGNMEDRFFPPSTTTVKGVTVTNGQITMVEFKLERIAPLKVIVNYPEGFSGDLGIDAGGTQYQPASRQPGKGFVVFPKLRKDDYSVRFTLSEQQKKKYAIEGDDKTTWSHDPYGTNEVTFTVIPLKLLRLEVTDAHDKTGGHYWCVKDAVKKVTVKAITEPSDARAWSQLDWAVGAPTGTKEEALVDISSVGDLVVKATLDVPKDVTIEVYDILKVDWPTAQKKLTDTRWKDYASDKVARMKVTTDPDEARVWEHLNWSEGAVTAAKNEADVDLKPVGDRTVTVTLDGKPATGDLHICQWPVLEINRVAFGGHPVLNDGVAEIGVAFDQQWIKGRPQHSVNAKTLLVQSPLCFTKGGQLKVTAEFKVTKAPTEDETVSFQAQHAYFGTVTADLTVGSGDSKVTTPEMTSTGTLPNTVKYEAAWTIDWEHTLQDKSWTSANSSVNPLYLTLKDPLVDVYFTLLDISCEAADGKASDDDFVNFSFVPFTTHTDDGNGFQRKGDGSRLSYYKTGYKTKGDATAQTPRGILSSPAATGRCGGWAALLLHMFKIHGVTTARQRWFIRATHPDLHDPTRRFLVKNIDFSKGPDQVGLYDYDGEEAMKLDGVPGQGKKNPQFDFGDHVVVKYGGEIYDPSYGIGPVPDDDTYLTGALDGLGSWERGQVVFVMADGTNQHIPADCTPYASSFAEYKIPTNLLVLANQYGVSQEELLDLDPVLLALRPTPDDVQVGDTIHIPLADGSINTQVISLGLTVDDIAAAHGVTRADIWDDPENATLKALRVTADQVQVGDTITVTPISGANVWVFGYDL